MTDLGELRNRVKFLHDADAPNTHSGNALVRHIAAARRQAFREVLRLTEVIDGPVNVKQNADDLNSGEATSSVGYIWAWLNPDGSGYVHHPVTASSPEALIKDWPELVARNRPDELGRMVKMYRLVEVLRHEDCTACEFMDYQSPNLNAEQALSLSQWAHERAKREDGQ